MRFFEVGFQSAALLVILPLGPGFLGQSHALLVLTHRSTLSIHHARSESHSRCLFSLGIRA